MVRHPPSTQGLGLKEGRDSCSQSPGRGRAAWQEWDQEGLGEVPSRGGAEGKGPDLFSPPQSPAVSHCPDPSGEQLVRGPC